MPDRNLQPAVAARRAPVRQRSHGYTLIELLTTVVVLLLVTIVALPSVAAFTARNRLAAAQADFLASLSLARSEAARRGVPVLLAAISGGATGNAYANGWRLVADANGNGAIDSGETVLRVHEALGADIRLDSSTTTLVYSASGYLAPASAVTYTLCTRSGSTSGMTITVPPSGLADSTAISGC